MNLAQYKAAEEIYSWVGVGGGGEGFVTLHLYYKIEK